MLLAAGAGRRYGAPKVLAHDGAWLRTAVAALADGGCDEVLVVLGARAAEAVALVPASAVAVLAADWSTGMGASLRAGLAAAEHSVADRAVLHLVDTPDVGAAVVQRLLATRRPVARAAYAGVPGHPVLLGRGHWDAVRRSASGDRGARDFLRARDDVLLVECGDLATGRDHDTPDPRPGEDLTRPG